MYADLFSLEDLALNLTLLQSTGNVVDGKNHLGIHFEV